MLKDRRFLHNGDCDPVILPVSPSTRAQAFVPQQFVPGPSAAPRGLDQLQQSWCLALPTNQTTNGQGHSPATIRARLHTLSPERFARQDRRAQQPAETTFG